MHGPSTAWSVLLVLTSSAHAFAQQNPARVYVAAGELDARLVEGISAELPGAIATSTSSADLLLHIERRADELEVTIRDQLGRPVLTRTVSLADGLTPALRRIVLVVAHAAENVSELSVIDSAPPPEPDGKTFGLSVSAGFAFVWWTASPAPQIGPTAAVIFAFDPIDVGARIAFAGEPCCRRTAQGISADARELTATAEAGVRAFELEGASLSFHAGLGVGWIQADVRPDAFAAPNPTQRFSALEPILEVGSTAGVALVGDLISLEISAGLRFRAKRTKLTLPEIYEASELDPGLVNPWIRAGAAVNFF